MGEALHSHTVCSCPAPDQPGCPQCRGPGGRDPVHRPLTPGWARSASSCRGYRPRLPAHEAYETQVPPLVGKTPPTPPTPPPGGGRGNPLQCSCGRIPWTGAWQATVLRVTKSQRRLEGLSMRVKKHHFEIPHWGEHSWPRRMWTSLGVLRLPVQPLHFADMESEGRACPQAPRETPPPESLCCSQLRSLPSWSLFT